MPEADKQPKILIVDDDVKNLRLMSAIFVSHGYTFETATNGLEAIEKAKSCSPDLIFLDIMMPGMDGYEVCSRLKEDPSTRNIPVVMVTALEDRESKIKGLATGAHDFLSKPVDSTEIMVRTRNLLRIKEFEDFLKRHNEILDAEVRQRTLELDDALRDLSETNKKLIESEKKIKESYVDTVYRLTKVAEYKDEDTGAHIKRISHYCLITARNLGLPENDQEVIFYASPMHDIGKVGIPSDILLKPARLTVEEFALMKTHTVIGEKILQGSSSELIRMAQKIAISHHERWEGGGYPHGFRGTDIPLEGRIMNIADQYDALRSRRPYKPPFDHETACRIITEGDGRTMPSHFDPDVLRIFKNNHHEFEQVFETYSR